MVNVSVLFSVRLGPAIVPGMCQPCTLPACNSSACVSDLLSEVSCHSRCTLKKEQMSLARNDYEHF